MFNAADLECVVTSAWGQLNNSVVITQSNMCQDKATLPALRIW